MTATVDVAGTPARGIFRQPKGLYDLAATEAWERFSYYGVTALVVLYMVNQLSRQQSCAAFNYGRHRRVEFCAIQRAGRRPARPVIRPACPLSSYPAELRADRTGTADRRAGAYRRRYRSSGRGVIPRTTIARPHCPAMRLIA